MANSPSGRTPRSLLPPISPLGSPIVGARMEAAFVSRTWSTASPDRRARRHAFLTLRGQARFQHAGEQADIELKAPFILWLPRSLLGEFRLAAGGEGVALSILDDFVLSAIGESGVAAPLRQLLDRIAVATSERIGPHLGEIETSFVALVRELRDPQAGASVMMSLHLGVILLHLWRASGLEAMSRQHASGANTVQRFRQLIELHYREGMSVDEFARLLRVTRSHLHNACIGSLGATPLALIHRRLEEEACQRLEQTELSIEQIGYSLGFRDPGYFNRFFKRQRGLAPGAYRRAARVGAVRESPSFAEWP